MIRLRTLRRLLTEDDGQDLIEYALLSAFIGCAGIAVFSGMSATMEGAYDSWVDQADSVADMPPPCSSAVPPC